jgi:hypothetical protein
MFRGMFYCFVGEGEAVKVVNLNLGHACVGERGWHHTMDGALIRLTLTILF